MPKWKTIEPPSCGSDCVESSMPLAKPLHETLWARREFAIRDDQGHTLYFGERI